MVTLLLACRDEKPLLCLALLVPCILYLFDHVVATSSSLRAPFAPLSRRFSSPLQAQLNQQTFPLAEVIHTGSHQPPLPGLICLEIRRYLSTRVKVRGRAPDVEGQFDKLS